MDGWMAAFAWRGRADAGSSRLRRALPCLVHVSNSLFRGVSRVWLLYQVACLLRNTGRSAVPPHRFRPFAELVDGSDAAAVELAWLLISRLGGSVGGSAAGAAGAAGPGGAAGAAAAGLASLMAWAQELIGGVKGCPLAPVTNLGEAWLDGRAFCALVAALVPDGLVYSAVATAEPRTALATAFEVRPACLLSIVGLSVSLCSARRRARACRCWCRLISSWPLLHQEPSQPWCKPPPAASWAC